MELKIVILRVIYQAKVIKQPIRSPVMTLVWRVKLIWVVQCFGFKNQRLVHCVDVTFVCNDLGLACQAYLDGFGFKNQRLVHCGVVVC